MSMDNSMDDCRICESIWLPVHQSGRQPQQFVDLQLLQTMCSFLYYEATSVSCISKPIPKDLEHTCFHTYVAITFKQTQITH